MSGSSRFLSLFCTLLAAVLSGFIPATSFAGEGFVSIQSGMVDSADIPSVSTPFKIQFGPQILRQFTVEFGLMDLGETQYHDPAATFSGKLPSFNNAKHGTISQSPASGGKPAKATFTGIRNFHAQGFLVTLRVNLPLTDHLDFFFKSGANAWWGEYKRIEIEATQTVKKETKVTSRVIKSGETSAVDQISGGGFIWRPVKTLALRAELETTALDSADFHRARFQIITLGTQFYF